MGVVTACGDEPEARDGLERLSAAAAVVENTPVLATIGFSHGVSRGRRRLALEEAGAPIRLPAAPLRGWRSAALLFAPVAAEIEPAFVAELRSSLRPTVAGGSIQGWIRLLEPGQPVEELALDEMEPALAATARSLDVLVASAEELRASGGDRAARIAPFRAWAGAAPELVVTLGEAGALLDDGVTRTIAPPRRVTGVATIGAGDAFAAVLTARRAAGASLDAAASAAAAAVVEMLEERRAASQGPTAGRGR